MYKIRIKRPCPTAIERDLYFISFLSPKFPRLLWSLRLLLPSRIILVLSSQSITSCLKCGCLNIPANKCRKMTMMHLWFHLPSSMQWFNHSAIRKIWLSSISSLRGFGLVITEYVRYTNWSEESDWHPSDWPLLGKFPNQHDRDSETLLALDSIYHLLIYLSIYLFLIWHSFSRRDPDFWIDH